MLPARDPSGQFQPLLTEIAHYVLDLRKGAVEAGGGRGHVGEEEEVERWNTGQPERRGQFVRFPQRVVGRNAHRGRLLHGTATEEAYAACFA